MITIENASGGGSTSQTITLDSSGASVSVGTFTAANGNDYNAIFNLTYDGISDVTASVQLVAL